MGSALLGGILVLGARLSDHAPARRTLQYGIGALFFLGIGGGLATVGLLNLADADGRPVAESLALLAIGGIVLYVGLGAMRTALSFAAVKRQLGATGGRVDVFVAARGDSGPDRRRGLLLTVAHERLATHDILGWHTRQTWSSPTSDVRAFTVENTDGSIILTLGARTKQAILYFKKDEGERAAKALRQRDLVEARASNEVRD